MHHLTMRRKQLVKNTSELEEGTMTSRGCPAPVKQNDTEKRGLHIGSEACKDMTTELGFMNISETKNQAYHKPKCSC